MLHQTFLFLGHLWQLFEVSQILEFLRYAEMSFCDTLPLSLCAEWATEGHLNLSLGYLLRIFHSFLTRVKLRFHDIFIAASFTVFDRRHNNATNIPEI